MKRETLIVFSVGALILLVTFLGAPRMTGDTLLVAGTANEINHPSSLLIQMLVLGTSIILLFWYYSKKVKIEKNRKAR